MIWALATLAMHSHDRNLTGAPKKRVRAENPKSLVDQLPGGNLA